MRFLEEKAPGGRTCPSCNTHSWTLQFARLQTRPDLIFGAYVLPIGLPFDVQAQALKKGSHIQALNLGRPLLPLICNECGFVKTYDYLTVWRWVHPNAEPGGSDAEQSSEVN